VSAEGTPIQGRAPDDNLAGDTPQVPTPTSSAAIVTTPSDPAAPVSDAPPSADEPQATRHCDSKVSFDDLYARIDDDLRDEAEDAVFLRYVSLANRLNEGICPEDLASDRFALMKALNSLSTQGAIALPEAIDTDASLFRIDLRDLGWDEPTVVDGVAFDDKWEAILAASPYAVELEGNEADQAKLSAATSVPMLFVDALIDAATVGNLYYALIGIGESEDELLEQLGIDEEDQEERGIVIKAGTSRSRLSRQDTVAERLEPGIFQGYYWARYDIDQATGGESIFADPFGFQQDSIAAVFSLPNGLNGYALFDAAGVRQVDTGVILDQVQRDGRVRNSVSCSQCHAAGINPITDEIRAYAAANSRDFDADTLEEIQDAFAEQPAIDDIIRLDSERYLSALSRAGLDAVVGDPVSAVYVRFDAGVSLSVAAGELGVSADVLRDELGLLSSEVDPKFAALRTQSLQREQFDALYLGALCALQVTSENRPLAADCAGVGQ
jgi:hypothetical protein